MKTINLPPGEHLVIGSIKTTRSEEGNLAITYLTQKRATDEAEETFPNTFTLWVDEEATVKFVESYPEYRAPVFEPDPDEPAVTPEESSAHFAKMRELLKE